MNIQHFRIAAGEDFPMSLVARDANNAIKDITGGTLSFRMAKRTGLAAEVSKSGTITSATDGEYTVTLTDSDTDGLSGTYVFRVYCTISGTTTLVTQGRIDMDAGVTTA